MKKQEEIFSEEKSRMKEQLHEIVTNEVNLLNRIKSLEADEGYSRFFLQLKKLHPNPTFNTEIDCGFNGTTI
jgi:hypothetical protein